MANASFRCFSSLFNNLAYVDLAECSTLMSSSRSECQSSNRSEVESLLENLQSDNEEALGICKDCVSDCVDNCLYD